MTETSFSGRKSLVLVVGAGASKEVGLPVGDELKKDIASSLAFREETFGHVNGGDPMIVDAFRQLAQLPEQLRGGIAPYLQASKRINAAMPQAQSIDNFIESHRSDPYIAQCGKLAIVSCILKAERQSTLWVDPGNIYNTINFSRVADTWFAGFFKILVQNCQREEVQERLRQIAVISFNYDRCLEHYLYYALQNYYAMPSAEATETLRQLEVFHPYGTVGQLPCSGESKGVGYGSGLFSKQLADLANQVQTFTEGTDENSSEIIAIRETLRSAERVAFLGFAFHPLNLELLYGVKHERPSTKRGRESIVYATALGVSDSDAQLIASDLLHLGGYQPQDVHLKQGLTASDLFKEYTRSLSLQ